MKIGVVGAGAVGATIAYAMVAKGLASRIVLADLDVDRAEGHAMDLRHCASFVPPVEVESGGMSAVRGMDIVVVALGVRLPPGEDPGDHARHNVEVVGQIAAPLARANPEAIFIVVSSPVDLLTLDLVRHGVPSGQVVGTGTLLDTSRLRQLVAARFGIDPRNVHAFVIGEHGARSSVPVWSKAMVAGLPLPEYARQSGIPFGEGERTKTFEQVLDATDSIVRRKGATFYGVAESVARIVTAISRDERSILTCSVELAGFLGIWDLAQSLPVVMGRRGIVRAVWPELDSAEEQAFRATVEPMRARAREMGI